MCVMVMGKCVMMMFVSGEGCEMCVNVWKMCENEEGGIFV